MFGIEDYAKSIVDFSNFEVSQLGDAFVFGGAVLLIGMVTIFAVLCLLWISLIAFQFFFHDLPEKRAKNAPAAAAAPAPVVEQAPAKSSNDEIVAVIAAAIAAAESENEGMKFRVVSFKRK